MMEGGREGGEEVTSGICYTHTIPTLDGLVMQEL